MSTTAASDCFASDFGKAEPPMTIFKPERSVFAAAAAPVRAISLEGRADESLFVTALQDDRARSVAPKKATGIIRISERISSAWPECHVRSPAGHPPGSS